MKKEKSKIKQNFGSKGKISFVPKSSKHPQRDRILIVCEDSKHSVTYFKALRRDFRLTSAEVDVSGESGSAPASVYEHAKLKLEQEDRSDKDNSYNSVYCVFDKDHHTSFKATLNQIRNQPDPRIKVIFCIPCFEYWLLLHFNPETCELDSQTVYKKLKKHIPLYNKKTIDYGTLFETLKKQLPAAIKHSKHTLKEAKKVETDNPSTNIHMLIEHLIRESEK